eukprot:m.1540363 g.1540363  ORF g.1540363 m.1540363 type:complete len:57 (+) comp25248_c0_seq5:4874-5044(+)
MHHRPVPSNLSLCARQPMAFAGAFSVVAALRLKSAASCAVGLSCDLIDSKVCSAYC